MTRLRPSLYMGSAMALWAIVSTLTAITQDFKGLLLTRIFLGVTEAPFYPGALYMLSLFYTRKEIATRISILFTGERSSWQRVMSAVTDTRRRQHLRDCIRRPYRYRCLPTQRRCWPLGMEMAFHHTRHTHFRPRHHFCLHPPGRASKDLVALRRRAPTGLLENRPRHGRIKS